MLVGQRRRRGLDRGQRRAYRLDLLEFLIPAPLQLGGDETVPGIGFVVLLERALGFVFELLPLQPQGPAAPVLRPLRSSSAARLACTPSGESTRSSSWLTRWSTVPPPNPRQYRLPPASYAPLQRYRAEVPLLPQ